MNQNDPKKFVPKYWPDIEDVPAVGDIIVYNGKQSRVIVSFTWKEYPTTELCLQDVDGGGAHWCIIHKDEFKIIKRGKGRRELI